MKNRQVFALAVAIALVVLIAGPAFAQVPIQPCKPRIKLKNFSPVYKDENTRIQALLEWTFCEMRDGLLAEGLTRFPGDRGNDVLKFLDGREGITFVWNGQIDLWQKATPTFMIARRGPLLLGGRRSILIGPLTFAENEITYTKKRRGGKVITYSEAPVKNLKHRILWALTWLSSLGIVDDVEEREPERDVAEFYYPIQRTVLKEREE